jgi:hypothetical protein
VIKVIQIPAKKKWDLQFLLRNFYVLFDRISYFERMKWLPALYFLPSVTFANKLLLSPHSLLEDKLGEGCVEHLLKR